MELSAQRVRSKTRHAVRRREDQIEQEEIESGELNLIPYLDIDELLALLAESLSGFESRAPKVAYRTDDPRQYASERRALIARAL